MSARRYGRRLRRGAAGTAVAAAAMAALSASQAPGFLPVAHAAPRGEQSAVTPPPGPQIDGGSPYVTALPPLNTPTAPLAPTTGATTAPGGDTFIAVPGGGASLPTTVFDAYRRAEASVADSEPGCHLPWQLLAAIGQVESGQARGGAVDANGTTYRPILGPVLNGNGFANIGDTDGGAYDGDPVHDRAVGPMQFIPSTWRTWGADGNGDGARDPNNVYDAALAAAHYLCADGRDLAVPQDMDRAILGYNHSQAYLNLVRSWFEHFEQGATVPVADRPGRHLPVATTSPSAPKPSTSPSPSASASPKPTPTGTGKPTQGPTPTTSPTGVPTTGPTRTVPPTAPPATGPEPTETPTDPPTTPGCTPQSPTRTPTPAPTGSGEAVPPTTPVPTPTIPLTDPPAGDGTPEPCATDTPTDGPTGNPTPDPAGTPDPAETAGSATGPAVTTKAAKR